MNKATIKISEQDYLRSQWLHYKFNVKSIFLILAVFSFFGYYLYDQARISAPSIIGAIAGFLIWYVSYFLLFLKWRCKKIHKQQKMLHTPTEIQWDEDGIEFSHASGHAKMKWSDFSKYKENKNLFLLYHSDVIFNILPKSAFDSTAQIENFKSHISAIGC